MEIKIRNIDAVAVKKIDELAKAKKMSRNKYLKIQIEKLAQLNVLKKEKNYFDDSLQMIIEMLTQMMMMINELQKDAEQLKTMFMLTLDVSEDNMEHLLKEFSFQGSMK